jgi:hypothetical protein
LQCKGPILYSLFLRCHQHLSFPKACQPPSLILHLKIYLRKVSYNLLITLTLRFNRFHFYLLHWKYSLNPQVLPLLTAKIPYTTERHFATQT